MSKYRVVKATFKVGAPLEKEVVKSNLPKGKAVAFRALLESKVSAEEYNPNQFVSYLLEPIG